jgi:hypothetical protein
MKSIHHSVRKLIDLVYNDTKLPPAGRIVAIVSVMKMRKKKPLYIHSHGPYVATA